MFSCPLLFFFCKSSSYGLSLHLLLWTHHLTFFVILRCAAFCAMVSFWWFICLSVLSRWIVLTPLLKVPLCSFVRPYSVWRLILLAPFRLFLPSFKIFLVLFWIVRHQTGLHHLILDYSSSWLHGWNSDEENCKYSCCQAHSWFQQLLSSKGFFVPF